MPWEAPWTEWEAQGKRLLACGVISLGRQNQASSPHTQPAPVPWRSCPAPRGPPPASWQLHPSLGGGAGAVAPSSDPPCDLAFPEATGFHWTGPVVQEGFPEHRAWGEGVLRGGGWATAGTQRTQATPVYTPANREGLWLLQGVTLHVLVKHDLYLYGRRNSPPGSRGWSSAE